MPLFSIARLVKIRSFRRCVYEKLEKKLDRSFREHTRTLLVRPSAAQYKISGLLCHVIVLRMALHMLTCRIAHSLMGEELLRAVSRFCSGSRISC